jgi:hypothetical protein
MRVHPSGTREMMPSVGKAAITADLVSGLIRAHFPQWAGLPVRRVEPGGWDNVTFRLGADMSVRLWKAMIVLVGALKDDPEDAIATKGVIAGVLADNLRI